MKKCLFFSILLLCLPSLLFARDLSPDQSGRTKFIIPGDAEDHRGDVTPFAELLTAGKVNVFSLKPTWGTSRIRDITDTTSTGTISDSQGMILVSTGSNGSGTATIETRERTEYQAGATMESGIGVRGPPQSDLAGGQFAEWGPFDRDNGFGFGADTVGIYVFHERDGNKTKIYQSDWNIDTLSGKGGADNPSAIHLSLDDGSIYQVVYTWYGFGDAQYYINVSDTTSSPNGKVDTQKRVLVHQEHFTGQNSVIDPNLPILLKADNGGEASNMDWFIGGRQSSVMTARQRPEQRPVNEFVEEHQVTSDSTTWEPLMAIRKKDNFPSGSGRENSVRVQFVTLKTMVSDGKAAVKVTVSDTTNATFSNITDWGDESAMESSTNANGFTAEQGLPFLREYIPAGTTGNSEGNMVSARERVVIGEGNTFVLWARNVTTNNATISAIMKWDEQW